MAETPVFLPKALLNEMADAGIRLTERLLRWPEYLVGARNSIPEKFCVAGESSHPHFLTADFALVRDGKGTLVPRLVELQAFPSVYAYQTLLNHAYADAYDLPKSLGTFLGDLTEAGFWELLRRTVLGNHAPENVVLTEVDPLHQKTLPDFLLTAKALGIAVVDITSLIPIGKKLHYRNAQGELIPIHRIYNRAIADEMIARRIELPFRLTQEWDVEWAGHPNWYFLISKYAVPWLSKSANDSSVENKFPLELSAGDPVVPPAVFLTDFLNGTGHTQLAAAGVSLPQGNDPGIIYDNLLLKPLFSFAGKGIQFSPSRGDLLAIPEQQRGDYLLQQRMYFEPTVKTPHGLTQAEIRILYLWPDGGELTPALSLVRLGRGKMMGVDHNKNQEWVGSSAAFWA
ncbi:hypothetical protein [Acidicapsa ligni]|uniref:hypothetical protein n=1 Tax=Acidicapsa ligni TaxID=542300 RepID=UPI0021E058DB|nr:hypothetical protein [Acidicapsa ligni]